MSGSTLLWVLLALAAAYILTGRLGLMLAQNQENATLIWAPTGISIAAIILWGRKVWPAIFVGALVVNYLVGTATVAGLGVAAGNTLEAIVGAWLLTNVAALDPAFSRVRDVFLFVLFGVLLSPIVSASIGVASLMLTGVIDTPGAAIVWFDWWLGDAGGAVVFAPLVLLAARGGPPWKKLTQRAETMVVFALTIATSAVPFAGIVGEEWQLLGVFMPFPVIAWAGLRLGPRGAVIASALTAVIAIIGTAQGIGPFAGSDGLYLTWAYMTIIGIFALILAASVSELETARAEREKLDAQLLNAQRLDSVGTLAGGIAHDFNNLLMPILGNAEMIRNFDVDATERDNMLADIETAAIAASNLCKLLLTYAGRRKPQMESVDVVDLIERTMSFMESSRPGNVRLITEFDANIPAIMCDPTQMQQIFLNLLVNGFESIVGDQGMVVVRVRVEDFDQEYLQGTFLHSDASPGRYVVIEVADDGEGMTKDVLNRLFDAFFSTKSDGRGLGMSVVQRIVRLHDGAIKVESQPSGGTTFRVLIPPAESAAIGRVDKKAGETSIDGAVLVVDDDAEVRSVTRVMLERAGYNVVVAEDGFGAVSYFEDHATEIRLVLLDVLMPGLDGKDTLLCLRRIDPSIPVIFMSGFDQAKLEELEDVPFSFVQKPFNMNSLLAAIDEAATHR